jgi:fatty acid-binding protein DegV
MTNKEQVLGMIQSTAPDLQEKAKKYFEKELGIKNFLLPDKAGSTLTVHIGTNCLGIMFFDELPENYVNVTP